MFAVEKEVMTVPGEIDPLMRELIYIAVSATNGCEYCIASHTAGARAKGMNDTMFGEVMAIALLVNCLKRVMLQKLIAHILSHVPNRYVVEGLQELSSTPKSPYYLPIQERIQIETVVHGSILHILRENADWLSRQIVTLSLVGLVMLPSLI